MSLLAMNTMLLKGKDMRVALEESLRDRIEALPHAPVFCDVVVGDDMASLQYVAMKERYAHSLGIQTRSCALPATATTEEVIDAVTAISREQHMAGLIVQLPLPKHIDRTRVLDAVPTAIDVDCLGKEQSENFYANKSSLIFPTVQAIMHLLQPYLSKEKSILVVGTGPLVGRPTAHVLTSQGYKVTSVAKDIPNLSEYTRTHDIIISGAGIPELIHDDMIRSGAVVIDAGTSEMDGAIVGDVLVSSLTEQPEALAPVPGGVGPLTVYFLMENVVRASEQMK